MAELIHPSPKMHYAPIIYRDKYFRAIACLIAAHILIMHSENISTLKALTLWVYYPTLLINYAIALILAWVIRRITINLDKRYTWEKDFWVRLLLQFFLGVVAVSFLSFLLVFIYFISFNRDVMKSNYPKFEFPFSVALLAMLNAFYALYYFYFRVKALDVPADSTEIKYKEYVTAYRGASTISLTVEEIATIAILDNRILLRTFKGEDLLTDQTLDELESQLDPQKIFRINRQLLAHRKACKGFQNLEYGKLNVVIEPAPLVPATVSQKKASAFKDWM